MTKSRHDARPAHTAYKRVQTRRGVPGPRKPRAAGLAAPPLSQQHSPPRLTKAATLLGSATPVPSRPKLRRIGT
eukprot:scaffold2718_cov103-Isochrysis_galbana.AAC.13